MKKVLIMKQTPLRLALKATALAFLLLILLPSLSSSQNMSWRQANGIPWDEINDIEVSPKGDIYMSTYHDYYPYTTGELYRSQNTGKTWEKIVIDDSLSRIKEIFFDNEYVFIGTEMDGIFRSSGNGKNWQKVNSGLETLNISSIAKDSKNRFYAYAYNDVLYYSRNNGDNWQKLPNSPNNGTNTLNKLIIYKNDMIVLAGGTNIYKSTDLGNSWLTYRNPDSKYLFEFCTILDSTIYCGRSDGVILNASVIDDSLKEISQNAIKNYGKINGIEKDKKNMMYVFTDKGLYVIHPSLIPEGVDKINYSKIKKVNNDTLYMVINKSELLLSKNHGLWGKLINLNLLKAEITSVAPVNKRELYLIINSKNICKTIDSCKNWFLLDEGISNDMNLETIIIGSNETPYILTDNNGVMKFDKIADRWVAANIGLVSLNIMSISVNDNQELFAITNGGLYKLDASDSVWNKTNHNINSGFFNNVKENILEIIQTDNRLLLFDTRKNIIQNIDIGNKINYGILTAATNSFNQIIVGTDGGGVYYTNDKGLNWFARNFQFPKSIVKKLLITTHNEFIAGTAVGGIFYSNNSGNSWEKVNVGLTNLNINTLSLGKSGEVYAGTIGSGLFICDSLRNLPIAITSGWIDSSGFKIQKMKISDYKTLQYSKDGKLIYTYSSDKYFRIWDLETGYMIKEYYMNYDCIVGIAIHDNGKYIAVMTDNNRVCIDYIYDLEKDSCITQIVPAEGYKPKSDGYWFSNNSAIFNEMKNEIITGVEVLEDGGGFGGTTGHNNSWDIQTGKLIHQYENGSIIDCSISADKKLLAINKFSYSWVSQKYGGGSHTSYSITLYDFVTNGQIKLDLDTNIKSRYYDITFSNNAKYIAAANSDNFIDIFNTSDGSRYRSIINGYSYSEYAPHCIRFSKNDSYLFVSSDNSHSSSIINIYDVNTSQLLDSIKFKKAGHKWIIDFSPDSIHFVIANAYGEMRLYSLNVPAVDSVTLVPITDMGHTSYKGYSGGLYPDGMNEMPAAHHDAGLEQMKLVAPLDTTGAIDQQNGKIVMLSIGMSNTTQEFSSFKSIVDTSYLKNPKLVLVDGAQGGQTASIIQYPDANYWQTVDQRLATAGLSRNQVQVIWLKEADAAPRNDFPIHARSLTSEMMKICQNIKSRYPNTRLCYVSSRTYGGYATTNLNSEPMAFESGFSMKWLIQSQIEGDTNLAYIGSKPKSPWLSWGPYLWANGMEPRLWDGLTWSIDDFLPSDRTHPSLYGRLKVANLLSDFFTNDETTKDWFTNKKTSVENDFQDNGVIWLNPSPASEYIEISECINPVVIPGADDQLRIYNALGEIVKFVGARHALPLRIDVSSLVPGLYFVRVGDKTIKFLKI